ncbi:MAG TPA: GC-type dockerin domain-anchored protein [Phycisphaerales bacterium]|nr:GC-type dockerin domain-anchored protein [Phycisphaerales bacterium]
MRTTLLVAACLSAVLAPFTAASPAMAQDYGEGPTTYYLRAPSSYQEGCWGGCACPLSLGEPMRGTFTLSLITVGDATDFYAVSGVDWTVPTLAGGGGQPFDVALAGAGTFAAGQHPFATHQHMALDLTLTPPGPWTGVQHFETTIDAGMRTVPPPLIDAEVANSTTGCPGVRLRIVATRCRADWNVDGAATIPDIFAFVNDWLAGTPDADFDGANGRTVGDVFAFLNSWFAGC